MNALLRFRLPLLNAGVLAGVLAGILAGHAPAQNAATFHTRNLPGACEAQMNSLVAAGHQIRFVAFPPAGGDRWSIVTDRGFYNRNVPSELHSKMTSYRQAGHKILCVAFPPAGGNSWTLITDKTFFNRNVPSELHSKMQSYASNGHRMVWVAYPPAGGNRWTMVTDKSFFNRGTPTEVHTQMGSFLTAGHKIRCVAYPPAGGNRWTIVTDRGYFNRGTPTHLHNTMRAMSQFPGGGFASVAYPPNANSFAVVSAASPSSVPGTIKVGAEYFSLDKFAANLRAQMVNKGVKGGFAIRIGSAVRSYSFGAKRTAYSPPAQNFSIYDRFNPASVSKTITAVALQRALSLRRVSINAKIYPYLPTSWTVHSSIRTITFRELLNHTSGLRNTSTHYYDSLKTMVATGVKLANKTYSYANTNYSLSRILLCYLSGYSERSHSNQASATAAHFRNYVQTYLMNPLGFPSVNWTADAVEPAVFYPYPPGTSTGTTYGNWTLKPGSAGIHMSLAELVSFLYRLRTSTSILSSGARQQMEQYSLGYDSRSNVKNATYSVKGGYFPASYNGGAQLHAYLGFFSNGIYVSALMNSTNSVDIKGAYNAAWSPIRPTLSSVSSSYSNVTAGSIVLRGTDLDAVTSVNFGRTRITNQNHADPTAGWFRRLSSTQILLHPAQPVSPGTYSVFANTSLTRSNSRQTTVQITTANRLLVHPTPTAGAKFGLVISRGSSQAPYCFLGISNNTVPSVLPGFFSFGIGNNFQTLFFWPVAIPFSSATAAARLELPSLTNLKGKTFYLQALYASPGLPSPTSNVGRVTFQ